MLDLQNSWAGCSQKTLRHSCYIRCIEILVMISLSLDTMGLSRLEAKETYYLLWQLGFSLQHLWVRRRKLTSMSFLPSATYTMTHTLCGDLKKIMAPQGNNTIRRYDHDGIHVALLKEVCHCENALWGLLCSNYAQFTFSCLLIKM